MKNIDKRDSQDSKKFFCLSLMRIKNFCVLCCASKDDEEGGYDWAGRKILYELFRREPIND